MDDRGLSLRVGAVVLTAAMTFLILVLAFGPGKNMLANPYKVTVRFPKAPGVERDTPVRKSGVHVGRVGNVKLLEDGGVLVTLELDSNMPIRANETPRISSGSFVTGDAIIEFVPDRTNPSKGRLKPGDFLATGIVMGDPFEVLVNLESRMTDTFGSIQRAAAEIETAATTAGAILEGLEGLGDGRERMLKVVDKAELALDQFSSTMLTIEEVFGDEALRGRLNMALEDLPTVMSEAKLLFSEGRAAVKSIHSISGRLDRNLSNLERFTQPLGDRGPEIVDNIDSSVRRLDEVFEQLVHMTTAINEQEGTLGKLVYDAEAYNNLNRLMKEADELMSVQVRAILDNAYIVSDKLARDPSRVIKDALNRSPSVKKTILSVPR
jgi:phospholipid/cholesterol/gamma-HCH transport system substrate-binding protein